MDPGCAPRLVGGDGNGWRMARPLPSRLIMIVALAGVGCCLLASLPSAAGSGAWGAPTLIENRPDNAWAPAVAVDASGNGTAVWQQFEGTRTDIWANRFSSTMGWGTATRIEHDDLSNATNPRVASDDQGNAVAVWVVGEGTGARVAASRYAVGSGWAYETVFLTEDSGGASAPRVASDAGGQVMVVFKQFSDANNSSISFWAVNFSPSSGWGAPYRYGTSRPDWPYGEPSVASDRNGTFVAAWADYGRGAYVKTYSQASGWGPAMLYGDGDAVVSEVAMDATGHILAAWCTSSGVHSIWGAKTNRYTPDSGWSGAIELDPANRTCFSRIAMDASGYAFAVWEASESGGEAPRLMVSRNVPSEGWETPTLLAEQSVQAGRPSGMGGASVTADGHGNAVAFWSEQWQDVQGYLWFKGWASRFTPLGGWEPATTVTGLFGGWGQGEIAGNARGNALSVMVVAADIWAAPFYAPPPVPPTLKLTAPLNGTTVNQPLVWVAGKTDARVTLTVAGLRAGVAANGSFGCFIELAPGRNRVDLIAVNDFGDSKATFLNLTFHDGIPELESELAVAQGQLWQAEVQLGALQRATNATRADLDDAEAQLEEAQSNLAQTQAQLTALRELQADLEALANDSSLALQVTEGNLSRTQANLSYAKARIVALGASGDAAQEQLDRSREKLDALRANLTVARDRLDTLDLANEDVGSQMAHARGELEAARAAANFANFLALASLMAAAVGVALMGHARRSRGGAPGRSRR